MEERWSAFRVLVGKHMGKKPLGTLRHKWGIILRWILKNLVVGMDWIDLSQGTDRLTGCCERDDERLDFLKCREFIDYLSNC
jgi:hypothetical protein